MIHTKTDCTEYEHVFTEIESLYDYQGTFDGNNKKIIGLRMVPNTANGEFTQFGLIRNMLGGTVKNLEMKECSIQNSQTKKSKNIGFIVGNSTSLSVISNCVVSDSTITSTSVSYLGGIAGILEGANITDCETRNLKINLLSAENTGIGGNFGALCKKFLFFLLKYLNLSKKKKSSKLFCIQFIGSSDRNY